MENTRFFFYFYSLVLHTFLISSFVAGGAIHPSGHDQDAILSIEFSSNNTSSCIVALEDRFAFTANVDMNGLEFHKESYLVNFSSADNEICTVSLTSCDFEQHGKACFCRKETGGIYSAVWSELARPDLSRTTLDVALFQSNNTEISRKATTFPHIRDKIQMKANANGQALPTNKRAEIIVPQGTEYIRISFQGLEIPFKITYIISPSGENKTMIDQMYFDMHLDVSSQYIRIHYEESEACQRNGVYSFVVDGPAPLFIQRLSQENETNVKTDEEESSIEVSGSFKLKLGLGLGIGIPCGLVITYAVTIGCAKASS